MYRFVTAVSILLLASPALAGNFGPGSDGPLNCETLGLVLPCSSTCTEAFPCEVQISLISAITAMPGEWETTPHEAGVGVYDPGEWAVVYQYTTIDIPEFVTVTFVIHPKGAPVVWLAMQNVNIAGTVELNGADGSGASASSRAIPGPGGFSGGIGRLGGSAGFGPGGGGFGNDGGGGGYGTGGSSSGGVGGVVYGRDSIVPLIGGSGGGADTGLRGGGAGGGAILIASLGNIFLDSTGGIFAKGGEGFGGGGAGSGGGIRLIANGTISGPGLLQALGGTVVADGGDGRIRIEAPDVDLTNADILPTPSIVPGEPDPVFPGTPAPILRVTAIDGLEVPTDPQATVGTGDVALTSDGPVEIEIELLNLLTAQGSTVAVRIVETDGGFSVVRFSDPLVPGGVNRLTASAFFDFTAKGMMDFDPGRWEVQLSVLRP